MFETFQNGGREGVASEFNDCGGTDVGTVRHAETSPVGAAGVPAEGASPAREGIVATVSELSSRNFAQQANDADGDHFAAITPSVISRETHYDQTKPTVTRTVIQAGDSYAAKPPGSHLPGGAGRTSGRTFGGHPGCGGAAASGGSAGGSPVAGAPAVVADVTGQWPALNSVSIDLALAAEGAAIARDMGRKAQLQFWEDLIADALYEHETGAVSHRRQAEAVLASLLHHGAIR